MNWQKRIDALAQEARDDKQAALAVILFTISGAMLSGKLNDLRGIVLEHAKSWLAEIVASRN